MNTQDTPYEENEPSVEDGIPTDRRPLGYWLRAVDALITREFETAFAAEDLDRRDWMLLNALSGDVDAPWLAARLARGGKRLRAFAERGWAVESDDSWELTDEGRAAQARLAELVQSVREKVSGAVSPEDWATLTASLQAIAKELGGDESEWMPRGRRGFGRPFGPGFGPRPFGRGFGPASDEERAEWAARAARHGFGPGHGPRPFGRGFGPGCDAEHDPHQSHHHRGHGHGHGKDGGRKAERAFERGFEAGFRAAGRGAEAVPADGAPDASSPAA